MQQLFRLSGTKKSSRDRVVLGKTTTANCDSKVFVGKGQKISEGMVFCYQNCPELLREKIVLVI